jgi:hypothetical protein
MSVKKQFALLNRYGSDDCWTRFFLPPRQMCTLYQLCVETVATKYHCVPDRVETFVGLERRVLKDISDKVRDNKKSQPLFNMEKLTNDFFKL